MCAKLPRPSFKTPTPCLSKRPLDTRTAVSARESPPTGITGTSEIRRTLSDAPWPEKVPFAAGKHRPGAEMSFHQESEAILTDDGSPSPAERVTEGAAKLAKMVADGVGDETPD